MIKRYNIVVVGAGLVGLATALSFNKTLCSVALIEAKPPPLFSSSDKDERALVLAAASQRLLNDWGVWHKFNEKAIFLRHIHVSERGRFGAVRLSAEEEGVEALGYVIDASTLLETLYQTVSAQENVTIYHGTSVSNLNLSAQPPELTLQYQQEALLLQADLIIAADGSNSKLCDLAGITTQKWGEGYSSLVAEIQVDRPNGVAYERFVQEGAIAMIPKQRGYKCIATFPTSQIDALQQFEPLQFLKTLQTQFGYRLGRWTDVGNRHVFPLQILRRSPIVKSGFAVIGNAAHTIYPLAAQGFNLGLRDVAVLADVVTSAQKENKIIGELRVLQDYVAKREKDHVRMMQFTEGLLKFKTARRLGMLGIELVPGLKHQLSQRAMGWYGT